MMVLIDNPWFYFCIAFAVMLLATWLMGMQGAYLFTKDPLRRKFSMMEMEFPDNKSDLSYLVRGIYQLPDEAAKTIKALRIQLLVDYLLFIPATYGGIFILCMATASKLTSTVGIYFFTIVAWGQCLCFALDYIENTYFWIIIGNRDLPVPAGDGTFKLMEVLEALKWGFSLVGGIGGFSAIVYFWLSGEYVASSLQFIVVFFAEIGAFVLLQALSRKKK